MPLLLEGSSRKRVQHGVQDRTLLLSPEITPANSFLLDQTISSTVSGSGTFPPTNALGVLPFGIVVEVKL